MKTSSLAALVLLFICTIIACSKESAINHVEASSVSDITAASVCDQLVYADTIFYKKANGATLIEKTLTPLTGTFGAFPAGLVINTINGNINVTQSESGLEYIVWYVATGTTDTCKKFITISGVNYNDSIYVLANNPSIAAPIYDANTLAKIDCSKGCEFDDGPDDDNGNGTGDEPPAGQELIPQGFAINKKTGVIDLKQSIKNGAMGKNPVSGTHKDFILNYRIGDKSSKALNHISFRLYYYATQAEVPANLKEDVEVKQGQVLLEDEDGDDHGGGHGGGGGGGHGPHGASINEINLLAGSGTTAKNGKGETKCRPPYIIVTQK